MGQEGDLSRTVYSEGGFYFSNEQMIEANECLSGGPSADYYPRGLEESQPNGSPRCVMLRNLTSKLVYRPTGRCPIAFPSAILPRTRASVVFFLGGELMPASCLCACRGLGAL
jgi:hypothetical protein